MTPFEFIVARIRIESTGYGTPCWLWTRALDRTGYAKATVDIGGKTVRVHRATYKLLVGEIGNGLHLDHLCRVRHCVNPAHLEAVSPRENTLRGISPPAINARKSHCIRGHEFSAENTRVDDLGRRWCLTCYRIPDPRRAKPKKAGRGCDWRARATHCAKGHEYTPENTLVGRGHRGPVRLCATCLKGSKNRTQKERRAAARNRRAGEAAPSEQRLSSNHIRHLTRPASDSGSGAPL